MPLYSYQCQKCERVEDAIRKVVDHAIGPDCCGEPMRQKITAPMLAPIMGGGNWAGYQCPVTGRFVTSRRERKNIMAEHDLVEAGDKRERKPRPEPKVSEHDTAMAVKEALAELGHS